VWTGHGLVDRGNAPLVPAPWDRGVCRPLVARGLGGGRPVRIDRPGTAASLVAAVGVRSRQRTPGGPGDGGGAGARGDPRSVARGTEPHRRRPGGVAHGERVPGLPARLLVPGAPLRL